MSKKALFAFLSALVICACTESTDEANTQCKDSEHLFADRCEFDDVAHCGTHTNDCTKTSGWKSGSCIGKTCFAEECHVGYHLTSHFDSENRESTICEEDTHDACGSSNTKCKENEVCIDGKCQSKCKPDEVLCDNSCINPMKSNKFCGANTSCSSFSTCSEFEECIDGNCVLSSCQNTDETICIENQQNICVNIHGSNPNHCGACGNICSDKETAKSSGCNNGLCTYTCNEDMINCGSDTDPMCLSNEQLQSDPLHCGACGNICSDKETAKSSGCNNGLCTYICNEDMINCGSDTDPMCLSNEQLQSDPLHCGMACLNCNTANFASVGICQEGSCIITSCVSGYILSNEGVCSKCQDICEYGCNDLGECICPDICANGCNDFGKCKCPDDCIKGCDEYGECQDNDEPIIIGTPVLTIIPDTIVTEYIEKGKINFKVTFKDHSEKGIKGQKITFSVDDASCIRVNNASKRTGADGTADNSILLLKPGCTANITAKATNAGKDYEAKLPVTINALSEYNIKLALKYENESRFSGVHFTAYKIAQDSCDKIFETYKGYDAYISGISPDGSEDSVSGNPSNSILNTFEIEDIDVEMDKSIVAWGAVDGFGDATAVGCIDVSSANAGQTVVVELEALPLSIVGTYDIIANFDLTSAFPPSGNALPPVENMAAGDWVKFTVDLFKEPVEVLLDFVWANTVSRLKAVSSDNSIVKGIIDFIVSDTTKQLAIKSLKPLIEKYLNAKEDGKQSCYQILKTVSPDVDALVRNMQFNGYFNIAEVDANDKSLITSASETFKSLEYQWNFVPQGGAKTCLSNAYAKPGACLTQMVLNGKLEPVNGNWSGSVTNSNESDGLLKINSHPVTFKWATILYSVVFGEMLPRAIGYSDSKYVSHMGADGYRYMTAFMNTLVYRPIAKYYGQEKAGKPKDNGDGIYPHLSIEGADKDCQRFIEALVYLIYSDTTSAAGVIPVVADLACGNQALGQLDALVSTSLSKSESSPENVLTLSASNCALYSEGQIHYQKMGKPDAEVHSAYEVIQGGKQSMRCNWQVTVPDSISKAPIKGLFHSVHTDF